MGSTRVFKTRTDFDEALDLERVEKLASELMERIVNGTGGPLEALITARAVAKMIPTIVRALADTSDEEMAKIEAEAADTVNELNIGVNFLPFTRGGHG